MSKQSEILSPNQKAIRRLLKNKPAIFGLCLIALAILVALFAYYLAPDSTPDANDQIPEIALSDPGFEILMIKVHKNTKVAKKSFLKHLISGTPSEFQKIPIYNYRFEKDSLVVRIYRGMDVDGEFITGEEKRLSLLNIAFPVDTKYVGKDPNSDALNYKTLDGTIQTISQEALIRKIEKEHIDNRTFHLGTDKYGRDMLSRLILGVRVSLIVGFIAVLISLTIGILLGALAGYFGGRVDDLIMLFINTVWSIPTLLLVFAIVLALGRGIGIIFLAVGLTMWVEVARIVRGQVFMLREIQFVEAAQSMGFGAWRIIKRHILPNVLGPVMVIAAANFATAILVEAGLSYLGFGIQPPQPSWGNMLNENYGMAIGGQPLLALVPAIAIMLLVLAFNLIGNGLRDALDVKTDT